MAYSQKLIQNGKDEFTGKEIKVSDWENLSSSMASKQMRFRIIQVDGELELSIKHMDAGGYHSISAGNELMFKLENNEIISLKCKEDAVSCIGCGATGLIGSNGPGLQAGFELTRENYEKLLKLNIIKARLYLNDGYCEIEVGKKYASNFIKSINMF